MYLCVANLCGNDPWDPLEEQLWPPEAARSKCGLVQVRGLRAFTCCVNTRLPTYFMRCHSSLDGTLLHPDAFMRSHC